MGKTKRKDTKVHGYGKGKDWRGVERRYELDQSALYRIFKELPKIKDKKKCLFRSFANFAHTLSFFC